VAELGCMSENESVEGRADRTEEAREEGQRVRMLRRTGAGLPSLLLLSFRLYQGDTIICSLGQ